MNVLRTKPIPERPLQSCRTLPTFEVGKFVYKTRPQRTVLAFETGEVATASYNSLVPRVSGWYNICTVRDSTLIALRNGIEFTISIDRVTRTPVHPGSTRVIALMMSARSS